MLIKSSYIHGKVCIVDDRVVICGSSNINDRVRILLLIMVAELTFLVTIGDS